MPTVWLGLLNYMKANDLHFSTFKRTVIGGSACPPAMMKSLQDDYGVEVIHAWGMTELSPLGTLSKLQSKHESLPAEARQQAAAEPGPRDLRHRHGHHRRRRPRAAVGRQVRRQPRGARAVGDLAATSRASDSPLVSVDGEPGWFPTGDVAAIDADGFMFITDRSKDVIKSGGEWISSIDLENIAIAHPAVHEAAVIACRHPKWDERPLLVVVPKPGATVSREELLALLRGQDRQVADPRRRRRGGRAAAHGHGQAAEAQAARAVPRPRAADRGLTGACRGRDRAASG